MSFAGEYIDNSIESRVSPIAKGLIRERDTHHVSGYRCYRTERNRVLVRVHICRPCVTRGPAWTPKGFNLRLYGVDPIGTTFVFFVGGHRKLHNGTGTFLCRLQPRRGQSCVPPKGPNLQNQVFCILKTTLSDETLSAYMG